MRGFLITLLCLAIFGTVAVSIFGAGNADSWQSGSGPDTTESRLFVMGVGNGEPTLFGVGLGQKIPWNATEGSSHYALCTNDMYHHSENIDIHSQWDCYTFSPGLEYRDAQFVNHRVYVDRTNRQVVAVLAHSLPINSRSGVSLVRFKNDLLQHAFSRYGQCETRLSQNCWASGDIYRTTFFPSPDIGLVISYHTQSGVEVCLYRVSAAIDNKGRLILPRGLILPERYPESALLANSRHPDHMAPHPATELYEEYRRRRQSTIGVLEKHFGISTASLKAEKISLPVWKNIALNSETGRFHRVVMGEMNSTWVLEVCIHDPKAMLYSTVIICRLRLFDTPYQAYAYGMEQLTSRLLPAEVMCDIFRRAEDVSDICFEIPAFANSFNSHPRVILMRANGVLECEFLSKSDDLAADAAWALDFFEKKSGTTHVDGAGESISLRR